jgi:Na+-transporting NADH:ubiquinone oxidoreductase subunit A
MIKIKKGLDLPITGLPSQKIMNAKPVKELAVTGIDYNGMKPTMRVKEGDQVKIGDVLFECKKTPGVLYTSPACGTVKKINRGERRVFQTMVISNDGEENKNFENYKAGEVSELSADNVRSLLVESGQWVALRTRPFSKVPAIDAQASSLFINMMDTNPLAADQEVVLEEYKKDFLTGVEVLSKLVPKTFIVKKKGHDIGDFSSLNNVSVEEFSGSHPAGLVGTHIHHLDPVGPTKTVWHINLQEVVAIGSLFTTGRLFLERVVALAGPQVKNPRLLRTRLGACICDLTADELKEGNNRVISGSVLNGRKLDDDFCYVGRYHSMISVIAEGDDREFLGWQGPGFDKYSVKNTYAGKFHHKAFAFTSKMHGSSRAIVPVGCFEQVMPLDILPTQLIKSLITKNSDLAQGLGCLELDEEDLALCTFVSPGKDNFGPYLRETLDLIEKEG